MDEAEDNREVVEWKRKQIKKEVLFKKILLGIAAGIILAIGIKIRVVLGILLIAIVLWTLLYRNKKQMWICVIGVIVGFFIGTSMVLFI